MITKMDTGKQCIQMAHPMMDNGVMDDNTGTEQKHGQMVLNTKEPFMKV